MDLIFLHLIGKMKKAVYILIVAMLITIVFIWDIYTPIGVADGMLYVPVMLLTLWFHEMGYTLAAGSITTLLIIVGYYFSPIINNTSVTAVINPILSAVAVWASVFLIWIYKCSEKGALSYKKRLNTLFENSKEGIIIFDIEKNIKVVNPKILKLLGYKEDELVGKSIDYIIHTPLKEGPADNIGEINFIDINDSSGKEQLFYARKHNAAVFPVSIHICSFESNGTTLFVCFIIDITEKIKQRASIKHAYEDLVKYSEDLERLNLELEERVEERTKTLSRTVKELEVINKLFHQELINKQDALRDLSKSRQMLETITDNFPNGMVSIINKDFCYLYVRGQEIDAMSLSSEDLIGTLFLPLRNKDENCEIKEKLRRAFNGEKVAFECYNQKSDKFFLLNGVPLRDARNEISQVLLVSQNVTALKKAKYKVSKALIKERRLNEMKSRFVSTASHEFRTPLGAILTSASLLSLYNGSEDQPKREKHINRINTSVSHLTEILNNFLSLGKIEEGKIINQVAEFDLDNFFEDIKEEMHLITKAGQKICINNELGDTKICLDKQLLRNILTNLISNSIKYSNENNVIQVNVAKSENEISFAVIDEGIGIPEADKRHLFETFYRASNVENIKGTGMGLHIIKRYLTIMNGNVEYESTLGKGSCFTVKFPV